MAADQHADDAAAMDPADRRHAALLRFLARAHNEQRDALATLTAEVVALRLELLAIGAMQRTGASS